MFVSGGCHQHGLGDQVPCCVAQGLPLGRHQLLNPLPAVLEQIGQLRGGEGAALAGSLQLDEFAFLVHHQVHVHLSPAVLGIAQVTAGRIVHHAHGNCRHLMCQRALQQLSFLHQPVNSEGQGHHRAGDGRGAGAAVGLQHIAVQGDGALAQLGQVDGLAQAAADQPLNLHAAAILLDAVALLALTGGRGQHGVFRRDPALPLALEEGRHTLLHRGGADHTRVAGGDQAGACGGTHKIRLNDHGSSLFGQSAINTHRFFPPCHASGACHNPK